MVVISEVAHTMPELEPLNVGPDHRRWAIMRSRQMLHLTFPMALDTADAKVERDYAAWPGRVLVIDAGGQVALDAGLVRLDWDLDAVEQWLLAQPTPRTAEETNELN